MESKQKGILIVSLIALVLMAIGITYAYFTADITGKETASTVVVTGGIMQIEYSENSNVILMENIYPREEAWVTKTITITGTNTTDLQMKYDLGLNVINNTFSHYLSYDLTLLEGDNGTPIANVTNKAINGTGYKRFGIGVFNNANSEVHKYELKIYLKDNNINQNSVQNAVFNAKVVIDESGITDPNEEIAMFLTGTEVNIKMKSLAGDDTTENGAKTENTTITAIQRSNTLKEGLTEENIVSTDTSVYPIYMWYEDGTIYYYTEANKPYLNSDASHMFRQLSNLTDISGLSEMSASNITNMSAMFYYDMSLVNISPLSNWDTLNVTDMSGVFAGQVPSHPMKINDLTPLANWDVSNVTSMYCMFQSNTMLTSLHGLENWDVSNVTIMQGTFTINTSTYNAGKRSSLTDISALSNWDTSSVTNMRAMFQYATSLTNLHGLENWNVSKVTTMHAMFYGDSGLKNLDALSAWDTSSVIDMQEVFELAKGLENIDGVKNWNTDKVTNMQEMFNGCNKVKEADIGNWDLTKLSSTTNANIFPGCSGLERLKTPKAYPTASGVVINLPVTLKDSLGTSYTSLSTGSPTSTWLTK